MKCSMARALPQIHLRLNCGLGANVFRRVLSPRRGCRVNWVIALMEVPGGFEKAGGRLVRGGHVAGEDLVAAKF
jgi:hypothetical protein